MNKTNTKLLMAEMDRIKELIIIIESTRVPEYDAEKGWEYNKEYFEKSSFLNQSVSELKSRLTMLRKDAIILRKDLEENVKRF